MSKAPGDVRDYDGSGDWFKVAQWGHRAGSTADSNWITWKMKQFTFKMPAEIPAGQYLIRIEQAATHQPYTGREFYVGCAHIEVSSSYNGKPTPTFKIPGVYSRDQWSLQPFLSKLIDMSFQLTLGLWCWSHGRPSIASVLWASLVTKNKQFSWCPDMEIGMAANWVIMSETTPSARRISRGCGKRKVEIPWVRMNDLSMNA
jgi:hypothetical protein